MIDDFCNITGLHYHVIASNNQFPDFFKSRASKPFSIPCLFNCLKLIIKRLNKDDFSCRHIEKIDEAGNHNEQHQLNFATSKRKLPNVDCVFTKSDRTQTDSLPTGTIERF